VVPIFWPGVDKRLGAELETLFTLQEIDVRLLEKKREIDEYERQLAERKAAMGACSSRVDQLSVQRKSLVNDRAFAERRFNEQQDQLKERRQRQGRMRTEKELRANENEIGSMRDEISQQEEDLLSLMAQVEQIESDVADVRKEYKEIEEADHQHVSETAARIEELKASIEKIAEERSAVTGSLDEALLRRYDRVLQVRGGRAVVQVTGGSCCGCFMNVPPQMVIEIMRTGAVRVCPNCQRILHVSAGQ
jgi:predicted  nucleic acid-binding Zn-ribbon protein